jgi:hypothetical protein
MVFTCRRRPSKYEEEVGTSSSSPRTRSAACDAQYEQLPAADGRVTSTAAVYTSIVHQRVLAQVHAVPGGHGSKPERIDGKVMDDRIQVVERLLLLEQYPGHIVNQQLFCLVVELVRCGRIQGRIGLLGSQSDDDGGRVGEGDAGGDSRPAHQRAPLQAEEAEQGEDAPKEALVQDAQVAESSEAGLLGGADNAALLPQVIFLSERPPDSYRLTTLF